MTGRKKGARGRNLFGTADVDATARLLFLQLIHPEFHLPIKISAVSLVEEKIRVAIVRFLTSLLVVPVPMKHSQKLLLQILNSKLYRNVAVRRLMWTRFRTRHFFNTHDLDRR